MAVSLLFAVFALTAFLAAGWALRLKRRLEQFRRQAAADMTRANAVAAFHAALLDNAPSGIVVGEGARRRYFGNGKLQFERLMQSLDAPQVIAALDMLTRTGAVFTLSVRVEGGMIAVRGALIGNQAALYLSGPAPDAKADAEMIDQAPLAMAAFDKNRRLVRYNGAYAKLWGLPASWLNTHPSLTEILNFLREKRLVPEQRNFAQWRKDRIEASPSAGQAIGETWHLPSGKSIHLVTRRHGEGGLFILCEDISEKLKLESSLNLLTQVQKATLDTLDEGVAIFGTDGRLVLHNALFAQMWQLTENDLALQPHLGTIAQLCASRIGRDGIWGIVAAGVNAAAPERFGEWGKARRADGRVISLALSRLPNGATLASFADLTDLEKFRTLEHKSSVTPIAFKFHQSA